MAKLRKDKKGLYKYMEDHREALERFDSDQELDRLVDFLKAQTVKTWQVRFERGKNRR